MSESRDGGAAFPQLEINSCERDGHGDRIEPFTSSSGGMSLRDYFAAAALPPILKQVYHALEAAGASTDDVFGIAATASYEAADALLAAREVKHG